MDERGKRLVEQLIEKTAQGKIAWSTAFEDGQFKTILPEGRLAFVVQVKGDVHRFRVLDEQQETVLDESVTKADTENEPPTHPRMLLYFSIGKLQELARNQALQVNEKLDKAEKILAAI